MLNNGSMFAPKYLENKLKFFPFIQEAVTFGAGRDHAAAMISIDINAVGNWAERNSVSYASYKELAAKPDVYEEIRNNIEQVNADLAEDPELAGAQIARFTLLHKELDADDGELTRTRKVRRKFINERYDAVIDALYGSESEVHCEVETTFEDGRKGVSAADLVIMDGPDNHWDNHWDNRWDIRRRPAAQSELAVHEELGTHIRRRHPEGG